MFKYSFVILCYVAFVSKQCSALNWCSSDALPTLLQCLLKAQYGPYPNFFKVFDQRMKCSKEHGDCTPTPGKFWTGKFDL